MATPSPLRQQPYDRAFYARDTLQVARALIGATLVYESPQGVVSGMIVETEAYATPDDQASHAYRGQTPRNSTMFGPPGHAYVYRSYGIHAMLNVVTEPAGVPAAVLIRALEPRDGLAIMARNRGLDDDETRPRNLTNGPGRLCQALGIGLQLNGTDLTGPPLYILPAPHHDLPIVQATRIGITRSVDLPWRFYLRGNHHVSVRVREEKAFMTEPTGLARQRLS